LKGGVDFGWELFTTNWENIAKELKEPSEGNVDNDAPIAFAFHDRFTMPTSCLACEKVEYEFLKPNANI
jgi:hypothetical protein